MLIVTGYLYVSPAHVERFRTEFQTLAVDTRQREGNISYDAAIEDTQSGKLILSERWADQAALTAHLNAVDTVQFVNRWGGLMLGDIRKYDALNERELMTL
ncbi:putative quinol monooxygenase [Pseudomonas sp. G.S.17]|uniref:putative quinol monooxygenase n=1 Tax=Pseudomonas sp. G.S.17 TaxID=3137451 RepID=UPI00311CD23F